MKRRMVYPDVLRALACIASVALSASLVTGSAAVSGLLTWAAPLFVMLSGMFLLDGAREAPDRKRFLRLLAAYLVWSLAGSLVNAATGGMMSGLFSAGSGYLSFLLVILILYAFSPALRVFTRAAQPREQLHLLLCSLLLGSFFPYLYTALLGESTSALYTALFGFGYIGVFAAGWILRSAALSRRALRWVYFFGAAFLVLTLRGIWAGSTEFSTVSALMIVSPDAIVIAAAIFLVVKNTLSGRRLSGRLLRGVGVLSNLSFGIYLIHPILLTALCYGLNTAGISLPNAVFIPLASILLLAVSGALTWCIKKIPKVGNYLV